MISIPLNACHLLIIHIGDANLSNFHQNYGHFMLLSGKGNCKNYDLLQFPY